MATSKTPSTPDDASEASESTAPKRTRAKPQARKPRSSASGTRSRQGAAKGSGRVDPVDGADDGLSDSVDARRGSSAAPAARRGAAARRPADEVALYQAYFKLHRAPFSIAPDPRALFQSDRHREALAHLLFGVQGGSGGFVLLTGEIGAGKTTVSRAFLEQLPAHCQVAWILNPRQSPSELLASICEEFGAPVGTARVSSRPVRDALPAEGDDVAQASAAEDTASHASEEDLRLDPVLHHSTKRYVDALSRFLLARHARGWQSVLIIDEAQNLSLEVLEQLRLLTNLETHDRKLLQIVLIGQPELRTMLAQPSMEQLAQRIIARYHLGPLNEPEVVQYVRHRLEVAGLQGPLPFHPQALVRIHRVTRGIPRRINLLCDRALLGAYAQGQGMVDVKLVDRAQAEVTGGAPSGRWAWAHPRRWGEASMTVSVLLVVTLGALVLLLIIYFRGPSTSATSPADVTAPTAAPGLGQGLPARPAASAIQTPATGAPPSARSNPTGTQPIR
ncbi:MAG: hypothetical protein RLZ83_1985 [Pseudomonadota bacterium]|jgi:general secretion pathway protein A